MEQYCHTSKHTMDRDAPRAVSNKFFIMVQYDEKSKLSHVVPGTRIGTILKEIPASLGASQPAGASVWIHRKARVLVGAHMTSLGESEPGEESSVWIPLDSTKKLREYLSFMNTQVMTRSEAEDAIRDGTITHLYIGLPPSSGLPVPTPESSPAPESSQEPTPDASTDERSPSIGGAIRIRRTPRVDYTGMDKRFKSLGSMR